MIKITNFEKSDYWLELCDDDLQTAKWLLEGKRLLHSGYFCHQVIEKAFKAVIAYNTKEIPPKLHDLPKLANKGDIWNDLTDNHKWLLKNLIPLQIEARYPEYKEKIAQMLSAEYMQSIVEQTEELLCWIKEKLRK